MRHTVALRREPSVHQTDAILNGADEALRALDIIAERDGPGSIRFRVRPPWRAGRVTVMHGIHNGRVMVTAGWGEPWRVRYDVNFMIPRMIAVFLSGLLVVLGWEWPRSQLFGAIGIVWLVYGWLYLRVSTRIRRAVEPAARLAVEGAPRPVAPAKSEVATAS